MAIINRFTKEEKELDRKETIEMLKDGIAQAEIARQLGRSAQHISNLKEKLISEGLITQKEIDEARQRALEERQASKKKINYREQQKQERKAKILEGIKNGKTALELTKQLEIPRTTVERYINELIEEGKIEENTLVSQKERNKEMAKTRNDAILSDFKSGQYTNKEIAKKYEVSEAIVTFVVHGKYEEKMLQSSSKAKKRTFIPNPNLTLTEKEQEVMSYLTKGYQYNFIAKQLGISQNELLKVVNVLKAIGAINSEQIKEAREEKRIEDEKEVISYLKRGFRQADILNQKKELHHSYLSRMITRLKEEKRITDEEIEEAIEEAIEQDTDKVDFEKLVLQGMKKGLTVKQIIDSDESRICYRKSRKKNEKTINRNWSNFRKKI